MDEALPPESQACTNTCTCTYTSYSALGSSDIVLSSYTQHMHDGSRAELLNAASTWSNPRGGTQRVGNFTKGSYVAEQLPSLKSLTEESYAWTLLKSLLHKSNFKYTDTWYCRRCTIARNISIVSATWNCTHTHIPLHTCTVHAATRPPLLKASPHRCCTTRIAKIHLDPICRTNATRVRDFALGTPPLDHTPFYVSNHALYFSKPK